MALDFSVAVEADHTILHELGMDREWDDGLRYSSGQIRTVGDVDRAIHAVRTRSQNQ
jgi:hypothetical protein